MNGIGNSVEDVRKYIAANTFDIQHAPCAVSVADLTFRAYAGRNIAYMPQMLYMRDNFFWQCVPETVLTDFSAKLLQQFREDPSWFKNLYTEQQKLFLRSERAWERQVVRGSDPDAGAFEEFVLSFSAWWAYGVVGDDKGRYAQETLEAILADSYGFSRAEAEDVLNVVTHPDELSAFSRARADFLALCTGDSADVAGYRENYFYAKTNYFDAVLLTEENVRADVERERSSRAEDDMRAERAAILEGHQDMKRRKRELLATLSLEPEDAALLTYLQEMAQWVDIRKVRMMKQFFWLFRFVHLFAEYADVPYEDAARYMIEEVAALSRNERVPADVIDERKRGFFVVYETDSEPLMFMQPDAGRLFETLQKTNGSTEIKGSVACRGSGEILRGKVQIILDPEKDIFEKGNILVTSMTRPEFVPLMRHALAIITDEGGIACHAAIVSRELGKPCIIGTKNGTRMLKDGDMVEVDANLGIVRIVSPMGDKSEQVSGNEIEEPR